MAMDLFGLSSRHSPSFFPSPSSSSSSSSSSWLSPFSTYASASIGGRRNLSPPLHLKALLWPKRNGEARTGSSAGICRASQAVDLFPSLFPEVVVRDARLEDCWEVADTHCSCFFPGYTFPVDLALRIDRFMALLSGFSVPPGCMRSCLVAISGNPVTDDVYVGLEDFKVGGFEGKFSLNKGSVAGILTVDTVADFLPRKGPHRQRRSGIAYISNVAIRESDRRKGIAKMLVHKAEVRAQSWGCRSIALHCDANNIAAMKLYRGQGFKCIKVPENAKWPEPRTTPTGQFNFMMKLLSPKGTAC